jgi:hypothetical protein
MRIASVQDPMALPIPASRNDRETLAHTLGFHNYPTDATAAPYINYIVNQHRGRDKLESYLRLFTFVVEFFREGTIDEDGNRQPATIRGLMDHLVAQTTHEMFEDTGAGSVFRVAVVEDTVMCIIGVWTMMLSSFVQLPNGLRKIGVAYNTQLRVAPGCKSQYCEETVATLIKRSRLIPGCGRWGETIAIDSSAISLDRDTTEAKSDIAFNLFDNPDYYESQSIKATRLNACRLSVMGGVDIVWTSNVSRHMILSRRSEQHLFAARGRFVLELFALPCAFSHDSNIPDGMVITPEQRQEMYESYGLLFTAWPEPLHVRYGRYFGIRRYCWCWACSAHRFHRRTTELHKSLSGGSTDGTLPRGSPRVEFDPMLITLINASGQPTDWSNDMFPFLWPRIIILENHLRTAKPKSIWALLRDRRDTLQYYTFL